jgi:hypothetical protein
MWSAELDGVRDELLTLLVVGDVDLAGDGRESAVVQFGCRTPS